MWYSNDKSKTLKRKVLLISKKMGETQTLKTEITILHWLNWVLNVLRIVLDDD